MRVIAKCVMVLLVAAALLLSCDTGVGSSGNGGNGDDTANGDDDSSNGDVTNSAPTASAEADDTTVPVGTEVTLDASGSSDPDGDALSFSWSLAVPTGSSASLSDSSAEDPTFTPDAAGDYTATVTVDDGNGGTDDATVTVTAQAVPTIGVTDDVSADTTWTADAIYQVSEMIQVTDATLTIEAGTIVRFGANAGISVEGDTAALVADGGTGNSITLTGEQQTAGFWKGILFDSDNPLNVLDHVVVEYAGGENWSVTGEAANVSLDNNAQATISNSTIRHSAAYGLQAENDTQLPGFTGNVITENDVPVLIPTILIGSMDAGSTYSGNTGDYVLVDDQTTTNDISVAAIDVPYRLDGSHVVEAGELTIAAGTTIEFTANSSIEISTDSAALIASGESGSPITMTGSQQTAGFWKGILFDSDNPLNVLDYVVVEYAGGENWSVTGEAANVSLDNNAQATISNSTIRHSAAYGLQAENDAQLPGFSTNVFTLNNVPILIPTTLWGSLDAGSTYTGNTNDYVVVYDQTTTSSISVSAIDVPYRMDGSHVIDAGEVTISAGTTLEFTANSSIEVGTDSAALIASGQSDNVITMTGVQQTAGFWKGILFDSTNVLNELTYVVVEYGGGENWSVTGEAANVTLDNDAKLSLTNCTIRDSAGWGGYADTDATVTASGNDYLYNAGGDNNYGDP